MQGMSDFGARPIDLAYAVLDAPIQWLANPALWPPFALMPVAFPIAIPLTWCLRAVLPKPLIPATVRDLGQGPAHRPEVAVPGALYDPECGLCGIGESGVDFVVGYRASGIADGKNANQGEEMFALWNWLKGNGRKIPYPQRVIGVKDAEPWLP